MRALATWPCGERLPASIFFPHISRNNSSEKRSTKRGFFRSTLYRGGNKGLFVLLSRTQAGPGRKVKQEQEEISRNHVQTLFGSSVYVSIHFKFTSQVQWEIYRGGNKGLYVVARNFFLLLLNCSALPGSCLARHANL